jgi:basic amino acid/polyamine antiporter, APA family
LIALTISVAIYVLTGLAATGLQNYRILAQSASPLAEAARTTGNFTLVAAVSLGALIATTSVLLTNLLGLSRVAFAMARNKQLPKSIAKVSSKFGTPYISIITTGALLTVLAFVLDLRQAAAITSFSLLCVHLTVNVSAINLRKREGYTSKFRVPLYPLIPSLGFISCLILMFSLPQESWIVAATVVIASAALYLLLTRKTEEFQDSDTSGKI